MFLNYKKWLFCLGVMFFVIVLYSGLHWPDKKLHVYFLDVGQGDSIFINTPNGKQMLIDGGAGNKIIYELAEIMPFFDRKIDVVVLTHPDKDHVGGLVEVLGRYDVEKVVISGVESESSDYLEFLRRAKNSEVIYQNDKIDFDFDGVFVDFLFPFDSLFGEHIFAMNDSSIVIKLVYKDVKILLTGDLETDGEKELLEANVDLKADILKVGHHGSKTSSSMDFLEAIFPEIAVIQCGKNNKFGHPYPGVLENLQNAGIEKIYRNDIDGRLEFIF
ncbi:competence protein ComE [Candidatus Peregrinibacteria bacterium CG10_big_fil_rev_8_21_14_0_10_36_19]|nr:MAG: competence protein ComE [Candidatus Peregrinibacteria bacterium CG10_big_fil_rev_8_21_14_0_10_36_19]